MVPHKLSVKNFLSYGENTSTLDFRDFTIACLSGRNGHGKSALIDALTWALWGRCRVKNKEEVIKRGASDAQVELEFESEGNTYRILRSIAKKKGGSQGTLDLQVFDESAGSFKPLDQGAKAQGVIEKILKMDYNSFICSSFILQGMADEFTKRTPAERKEVLSKILELDEYETLTRKAREHAQASDASVTALEAEAARIETEIAQKDDYEKKLAQLRSEEESVSVDMAGFETIRAGLIAEFESVKAKLDTLSRLGREREESITQRGRLEEDLQVIRESISKDREIVAREAEILKAFGEFESARERDRILNEKQLKRSNLEKEIERLSGSIEKEKAKLEQKAKELSSRIKSLEAKASSAGRLKKVIEGIRSRIEEC
ncbi:MAG TPA: AAA family ATPase, partial [Thermodesulfobacteriota bacterium]|nr:AAA family ATPase [Thermodesulfobacteriota bacterium]